MKYTLLAPAGSPEALEAAVACGADAVYLGIDLFNARLNAANFTLENLGWYVDYCHVFGVKVYVTLNTLVKDSELDKFFGAAKSVYLLGADAIILQDTLFGPVLREFLPDIELHLSTQAGVCGPSGAAAAKAYGFSQIVAARETTLADLADISKIVKTEAFVQGALCSSFSGQCYMSGFAGGNSGNRGLCKQPCRQKYLLSGKSTPDYAISLSDLCVGSRINELIAAGVTAFKIEGRMRRPEYVAAATKYYRALLDGRSPDISPLRRAYNRGGYTAGLAFGQDKNFISAKVQSHIGEKIGVVKKILGGGKIEIDAGEPQAAGSAFKILRNGYEIGGASCKNGGFVLDAPKGVKAGDDINITTDAGVPPVNAKKLPVEAEVCLAQGREARFCAGCRGVTVEINGGVVQAAQKNPLTRADVEEVLLKTDKFPFGPAVSVTLENAFMPRSELNGMRRGLYQKLFDTLAARPERRLGVLNLPAPKEGMEKPKETAGRKFLNLSAHVGKAAEKKLIAVLGKDFSFNLSKADIAVFAPENYNDDGQFELFFRQTKKVGQKLLYMPVYVSGRDEALLRGRLEKFDGVYAETLAGGILAKERGKKFFWGPGRHIFNRIDLAGLDGDYFCLSNELTKSENGFVKNGSGKTVFTHALGAIKLMTFVYCPFGKNCAACKTREWSSLDDGRRVFLLRRIKTSGCLFELFNYAPLVGDTSGNALLDARTLTKEQTEFMLANLDEPKKIKEYLGGYTTGHTDRPVI